MFPSSKKQIIEEKSQEASEKITAIRDGPSVQVACYLPFPTQKLSRLCIIIKELVQFLDHTKCFPTDQPVGSLMDLHKLEV